MSHCFLSLSSSERLSDIYLLEILYRGGSIFVFLFSFCFLSVLSESGLFPAPLASTRYEMFLNVSCCGNGTVDELIAQQVRKYCFVERRVNFSVVSSS